MPRANRIVVPGLAHHVIQRGNRQQPVFFSDSDRRFYIETLATACARHRTRCLAWCLMDNHVHLVLIPATADGLRATLAWTHTIYAQRINRIQATSGHLFQGRFASYPMDDAHMMIAVRYVENNPVKAGLVARAEDWQWSSARAHVLGVDDRLTDRAALKDHVANWRAMLGDGLEASDRDDAVEASLRLGRPAGSTAWMAALSDTLHLPARPARVGRPSKPRN